MRYAVVAVQGSAIAQSNLAWLLKRSSSFDSQHRRQMCLRLLSQAAKSGLLDAWVDAGDIQYHNDCPGSVWLTSPGVHRLAQPHLARSTSLQVFA